MQKRDLEKELKNLKNLDNLFIKIEPVEKLNKIGGFLIYKDIYHSQTLPEQNDLIFKSHNIEI